MEERRWRTEDQAQSKVYEQFNATVYHAHPYGRPIVGWMDDLENMTDADAREWYKTWYAPNNALLVVVGDVNPQEVFKLAKRHFGPLKSAVLPQRKPQVEPEQKGERRIIVKAQAELPYVLMGFRAPALKDTEKDWEPYALELLAGVLDGNASARLNQQLVRESQIAVEVGAGYSMLSRGRQSLFMLEGTPSQGKTVADLEAALLQQVDKIKTSGVTPEELQRVKAQVIAAEVYKRDSMFYQSMQIGQLETMGYSWKLLDVYQARLEAITPQQVQEVARKYLVKDVMTVATLDPQPIEPNKNKAQVNPHAR
jgi:zinc protease